MKRIVVLGGGYGGILTAKHLEKKLRKVDFDVKITIIDKNPYHTMLTELHEVAAGRVHEDSIKIYFDQVIAGRNIDFELAEIKKIDFEKQKLLSDNKEYPYDYLVIGTGCKPTFFGHDEYKEHVFTLWSLEDAVILHEHIVEQFRKAAKTTDEDLRKQMLTFVVVGAGFTGVEMAGELAEYVPELCHHYRVKLDDVSIKLLDMAPRVLPTFPEKLSNNAVKKLEKLGVECYTGKPSSNVTSDSITFGDNIIKSETIIWTTGVEGSELIDTINEVEKKGRGRLVCNKYLQVEGRENVYVVGDNIFYIPEGDSKPVPQMVENAENSAKLVAYNIVAELKGKEKREYRPKFHGAMVSIGSRKGLAQVGTPKRMFNIKNSCIALFIKHFINVIYFMQVLGWHKVWSYIKHEFFNTRNNRSVVGGLFSKKTPNIWTVPIRLWLGFMWVLQGLPKVIRKISGGWDSYCTLSEFPATFENNGLICSSLGKTVNIINTTPYPNVPKVPATLSHDTLTGFDKFLAYINDFFAGFRPTENTEYGLSYNVLYIFEYYQTHFKWIGWLFSIFEFFYNIFMVISEWFMNTIVTWMAPFFEFGLAIGELGVGILLILGLFTVLASTGSLILTLMIIVGSLFSYNGIFLSELIWYLVASIVLLNFGGDGNVLSLDYYVMPKVRGFLQRIPFVKKWYLYGEKVES
ncbi:MAG TPA: FAD-dependent oxidoreductase [Haloplasmataceae bacterium]